MTRPLYKDAARQPDKRHPDGHAGLWFDKFCDRWRIDESWALSSYKEHDKECNPKLEWIAGVTQSPIGKSDEIEEYVSRLIRLVESRGGRFAVFRTESRFVTGLGRSHPVENGFSWHPTLGTPYLPGSSVKGLVRAWAKMEAEPPSDTNIRERLFGSAGNAGCVGFMDVVPIAPVRLEADVMTPHYAGWNKKEPPGDWMSPTPIPFLTVAAGISFLFALVPCRAVVDDDLGTVMDWLNAAVAWAGGGAKTAVGYGRFGRDDERTRSWTERVRAERVQRDAMKSPAGRWHLELEDKTETEVLDQVRIHLEKERLSELAERRAFADAVFAMRSDWVKRWRDGMKQDQKTSVGSKKLKERARLLDEVAAETASDRKQPD